MSSRTLYVVRHAEASGEAGEGLTEVGRRQAEALGDRLAGVGFSTVFHGPLPRAAQTASIVVRLLSPGGSVSPRGSVIRIRQTNSESEFGNGLHPEDGA